MKDHAHSAAPARRHASITHPGRSTRAGERPDRKHRIDVDIGDHMSLDVGPSELFLSFLSKFASVYVIAHLTSGMTGERSRREMTALYAQAETGIAW